jgi:hypothetical protein
MPSTATEPLVETWSDAARKAALEARRRHMKSHGSITAAHLHSMDWPTFTAHYEAAHASGDKALIARMHRVAAQYDVPKVHQKKMEQSRVHHERLAIQADLDARRKKQNAEYDAHKKSLDTRRKSLPKSERREDSKTDEGARVRQYDPRSPEPHAQVHERLFGSRAGTADQAVHKLKSMTDDQLRDVIQYVKHRGLKATKKGGEWQHIEHAAVMELDDRDRKERKGSAFHRGGRVSDHLNAATFRRDRQRQFAGAPAKLSDTIAATSTERLKDARRFHVAHANDPLPYASSEAPKRDAAIAKAIAAELKKRKVRVAESGVDDEGIDVMEGLREEAELREAWSPKSRQAALLARMRMHPDWDWGGKAPRVSRGRTGPARPTPAHHRAPSNHELHNMGWGQFNSLYKAALDEGNTALTDRMDRIAAQYGGHPGHDRLRVAKRFRSRGDAGRRKTAAALDNAMTGPLAGIFSAHVAATDRNAGRTSPGRGPTGRLRNFRSMSDSKLRKVMEDVTKHGKDREAMQAVYDEGVRRGWSGRGRSRRAKSREASVSGFAVDWAERILAEAGSILATSTSGKNAQMVSSKLPLSTYFHANATSISKRVDRAAHAPRAHAPRVKRAPRAWTPPMPGVIRGGPHAGGVFKHGGNYTGAAQKRVGRIQHILRGLHLSPGRSDGVYGNRTTAAVRKFQAKHHLLVDGIVGAQTLAALKHYSGGRSRS